MFGLLGRGPCLRPGKQQRRVSGGKGTGESKRVSLPGLGGQREALLLGRVRQGRGHSLRIGPPHRGRTQSHSSGAPPQGRPPSRPPAPCFRFRFSTESPQHSHVTALRNANVYASTQHKGPLPATLSPGRHPHGRLPRTRTPHYFIEQQWRLHFTPNNALYSLALTTTNGDSDHRANARFQSRPAHRRSQNRVKTRTRTRYITRRRRSPCSQRPPKNRQRFFRHVRTFGDAN